MTSSAAVLCPIGDRGQFATSPDSARPARRLTTSLDDVFSSSQPSTSQLQTSNWVFCRSILMHNASRVILGPDMPSKPFRDLVDGKIDVERHGNPFRPASFPALSRGCRAEKISQTSDQHTHLQDGTEKAPVR